MARLLYVCVRPEEGAAAAEHASFARGLGQPVDRHDLLSTPLGEEDIARYAGVVVGGSPLNVSDPDATELQRRVEGDLERLAEAAIASRTAALFTCYGIGVVTRMLGGRVTLDHPEPASAVWVRTRDAAASDPLFAPSAPGFHAFSAHKEASAAAPPDAVLLASSAGCPVQAYRVGTRLWATQFHPEPTPRDFAERMGFYRTGAYFAPEDYERARNEVLAASVTEPAQILARFAAVATRPEGPRG